MKISEFKQIIDRLAQSPISRDSDVCVVVSEPSIGATATISVKTIGQGFDWNHGKVMIFTEQPIIRKKGKS